MIPDERDTIVAVASAPGGGARGVVRLSGPDTAAVVERILAEQAALPPTPSTGAIRFPSLLVATQLAGRKLQAPCDLYFWPDKRSYTRQPSAELHTLGSAPLLASLVETACSAGARLAEPGEFTLRAFLAGRIDLTQVEAVLGVIDAQGPDELQAALGQLAGGLSAPLARLREDLLQLLADLEAGLDFVDEEDVRFIEPDELIERLASAAKSVQELLDQTTSRARHEATPRVAIAGPPNAGKSSLFNAIQARWGVANRRPRPALVSPLAGTTRDSLNGEIEFDGMRFELIDTAGLSEEALAGPDASAQQHAHRDAQAADLSLYCLAADSRHEEHPLRAGGIPLVTKSDLVPVSKAVHGAIAVSSLSGEGLEEMLQSIVDRLRNSGVRSPRGLLSETTERCRQSLLGAVGCLQRAATVAAMEEHDLVALELRAALGELGQVVGAVVNDDVLDRIFSQFCIGK